ncbi:UvrD-helicase domain-containing protein [Gordonia neofelifaecis]|uniref:Superfamily I DNA and RNA helicase-like protein n=1 Tax=Gordonia neofelifaecis NRRL B-59395 TaxID=644548 RepID=F1YPS0_9ACTN|nr:UvrD-helicase domain-containing protein [Gordonia neofelifaecis]EGD53290.1 Superfamily I DNA and RNA helicase-like protein [Gordonia neofelifaecis NRRL B-59395]
MELDPSQRRVTHAPHEERLLVSVGAGQGKSEVVAARLVNLLVSGLSASTEILVLSFSRAAVHVIRNGLADRDVVDVKVRTFDSFASELLLDLDLEPTGSYGARIRQATDAVQPADEPPAAIGNVRHLVVDEAQDLAILDTLPSGTGLTVLSDTLRSVSDFVESESETASETIFDCLRGGRHAETASLDRCYPACGSDCFVAIRIRAQSRGGIETYLASLGWRAIRIWSTSTESPRRILSRPASFWSGCLIVCVGDLAHVLARGRAARTEGNELKRKLIEESPVLGAIDKPAARDRAIRCGRPSTQSTRLARRVTSVGVGVKSGILGFDKSEFEDIES